MRGRSERKLAKRLVAPDAIEAGLVCPDHWSGPDWVYTDGPAVAEINAKAGFEPDPQQQLGLDLIFALNEMWLPAAFSFCVICARQNLKTGLLKQACIGWLAVTDEQKIVWSSHELSTTIEAQTELHDLLESSPALSRLLPATKNRGKYDDNLQKRIELTSRQRVLFKARTQTGGRGLSGDKTVLDEAFALQPSHVGSLLPTMLARPHGQVFYASSPGLLDSAVLRDVRDRGRAGSSPRMFYLEWGGHIRDCADPDCLHPKDAEALGLDCALDDRELWKLNNPVIQVGRSSLQMVADLRQELPPDEFLRECMGQWEDPSAAAGPPAVNRRRWSDLGNPDSPPPTRAVAILDVEPDRSAATVGLAGNGPGGRTLLMVEHRPGSSWVASALEKLKANGVKLLEVALHPSGQAGALAPQLTEAGIDFSPLVHKDLSHGCSGFQTGVEEGRFVHLEQPELDAAVHVARTRMVNEAQLWDRNSHVPLGPLVSVSTAAQRWALLTATPHVPPSAPRRAHSGGRADVNTIATVGF